MTELADVFTLRPEALECPYQAFVQARETLAPVVRYEADGFWVVTSHELASKVLRDGVTFSTRMMLGAKADEVWTDMIRLARESPEMREQVEGYGATPRKVLLFADPPEHTKHRALINATFTPSRVKQWDPMIRSTVCEILDGLAGRSEIEVMADFAGPYTMRVIADILGLTAADVPNMERWARDFNSTVGNDNLSEDEVRLLAKTRLEFDQFFDAHLDRRLDHPQEDLLTDLVQANAAADEPLARDELYMIIQLTMVGGSETSATFLAEALLYLAKNREVWQQLRGDRTRVLPFVEELMRLESPVQGVFRLATRDVQLGDILVSEGDLIWVSFGAANRDPSVFPSPDEFEYDRQGVRRYLSFSGGPHHCVGAGLARSEIGIALDQLLDRYADVELVPGYERPAFRESFLFHGPEELHLKLVADTETAG